MKYKSLNLLVIPEEVSTSFRRVSPENKRSKARMIFEILEVLFLMSRAIHIAMETVIPMLPMAIMNKLDMGNVISIFVFFNPLVVPFHID